MAIKYFSIFALSHFNLNIMSPHYRTLLLLLSTLLCLPVIAQSHRDPILITETPEGEFHSFTRNTYYVYWDMQWTARLTDGEINVVTNGDTAFIQNPLYYCHLNDTWWQGVTMPLQELSPFLPANICLGILTTITVKC